MRRRSSRAANGKRTKKRSLAFSIFFSKKKKEKRWACGKGSQAPSVPWISAWQLVEKPLNSFTGFFWAPERAEKTGEKSKYNFLM